MLPVAEQESKMPVGWSRACVVVGMLGLAVAVPAQHGVYGVDGKAFTATVEVLAQVSAIHSAYAGNQQTYLAREAGTKSDAPGRMLLLEDRSIEAADPIRRSLLREHHLLRMRLVRDEGCDRRASHIVLEGTTSEVYREEVRGILSERAGDPGKIPCYQVEHAATHLAK